MELNEQIGKNLKQLRQEQGLSLSRLAELCGISGVMLSQIEKGAANPTINTIWKIANGLKVPYTVLVEPPQEETAVVIPKEEEMQYSPDGKCRIFCYYPVSPKRKYELFTMEMEAEGEYVSPGHPQHSREYVIVGRGAVEIQMEEKRFFLKEGESLTFFAALPHCYRNVFDGRTNIFIVNDYTE